MRSTENQQTGVLKRRGRPPSFNYDEALEKAMQTFWMYGYEGTSMAALIEAMEMNKPSIYAAFGNKEALFNQALEKYVSGPSAFLKDALKEPTSYLVAKKFLTKAVALLTQQQKPRGCMIVQGALSCGPEAEMMQKKLIAYRANSEALFKERFDLAKANADLPKEVNTSALAKYVATIHQGISVQAFSGASKDALMEIVDIAMQSWPSKVNAE
ncbi:MAG: TetR family transcriptional regulator [Methylotenera sp.]|uniref:TetR/AcrR family transcriptional regulator n=1 Tax=Methylotenera sp. TaxID=2051956 RepID=UPI000D44105C|nr:TetR/AcrR family transcriptional regulator [Methylotenera sp.]PPC83302.1 MAG: TetR family transcriptional regulator [Methylotenera sp.]